ncbi:sugar-binding protein [Clostridium sp. Marseille-P3244]|uniref:sugar-binding protein n=1 Tax=Clostridium sp. Marseille-P3244 TaxID=1871020 RepID=UPI000931C456|nr:sugar-binding protein [Clostridium sp. Marseille-P3244]
MKKRIMSVLLAGLITAGMLAGCQKTATESNGTDTEQAGTEDSSKAKYNYTFVSPLINHEYWMTVDEGIQAEAEATGVSVNTIGETKVDVDAMTKYIDSAIASKVDGIITMALSPSALGPAIDRAEDAGIPVILIDTDAPDSKREAYVGTSNYDAGKEAGEAMIEATGGNAKIGIIRGSESQETDTDRIQGFEDAIAEEADMEIIDIQACDSDMLTATQKVQDMLRAYPEITAIFGSEGTGAVAAGKILVEQGREGEITVIGFDDTDECLDYIRQGVVYGTIAQKPNYMGKMAVDMLNQLNDGEELEETLIDSGVTLVTADNVDTYVTQ